MIKPLADYCDYVLLTYTYHWLPCTNDIYQWLTCTHTNDLHEHVPMTYMYMCQWLTSTIDLHLQMTCTIDLHLQMTSTIDLHLHWLIYTIHLHVT